MMVPRPSVLFVDFCLLAAVFTEFMPVSVCGKKNSTVAGEDPSCCHTALRLLLRASARIQCLLPPTTAALTRGDAALYRQIAH